MELRLFYPQETVISILVPSIKSEGLGVSIKIQLLPRRLLVKGPNLFHAEIERRERPETETSLPKTKKFGLLLASPKSSH